MPCQGCNRRKAKIKRFIGRFFNKDKKMLNLLKISRIIAKTDKAKVIASLTEEDKAKLREIHDKLAPKTREYFLKSFDGKMGEIIGR